MVSRWTPILAQASDALDVVLPLLLICLLCGVALLIGIRKCWSISRQPGVNSKCVMALGLLLMAWLIPFVTNALALLVGRIPFGAVVSFIIYSIVVASGVLAVTGLYEYSRGRYTRGRAHAVFALILSAFITALPVLTVAEARWNILGVFSQSPPKVLFHDDLNFKFFAPGGVWSQMKMNALDQLIAWGPLRHRDKIAEASESLARRFEVLDYERRADVEGTP